MLYLGHFYFDGHSPLHSLEGPTHGRFTCLVEAEDLETAIDKLRDLIEGLKGKFDGFDSVTAVYFDVCIEIKKRPPPGVLAYFAKEPGELDASGAAIALPGVPKEVGSAWGWSPTDKEEDQGTEPFVRFEQQRKRT